MNKKIFNEKHIFFDSESKTQEGAFRTIAHFVFELGYIKNEEEYYEGLIKREQESTTGFKDNIAIPHCKDETNIIPGMFLIKFKHDIPWNSLDGKPVKVAFALTIPVDGAKEHLKLLSIIARKLINDDFRKSIQHENNLSSLNSLIDEISY